MILHALHEQEGGGFRCAQCGKLLARKKKEKGSVDFYDDTAMGNINKYDYIKRNSYRKY